LIYKDSTVNRLHYFYQTFNLMSIRVPILSKNICTAKDAILCVDETLFVCEGPARLFSMIIQLDRNLVEICFDNSGIRRTNGAKKELGVHHKGGSIKISGMISQGITKGPMLRAKRLTSHLDIVHVRDHRESE